MTKIVCRTLQYCNNSLLALGSICSLFIKQENIHSQYRTQHEQYRGTDRIRMVKQFQDRGRRRTYVNIYMQRVRAGGNPRESGQNPRLRSERQVAINQGMLNETSRTQGRQNNRNRLELFTWAKQDFAVRPHKLAG